jgi:hypothetical protein
MGIARIGPPWFGRNAGKQYHNGVMHGKKKSACGHTESMQQKSVPRVFCAGILSFVLVTHVLCSTAAKRPHIQE